MLRRSIVATLLTSCLLACSAENELVGVWKATAADMSFADGRIPADQMDEVMQVYLEENAPAFDLNSDGTARVFGGGHPCNGTWTSNENIVEVQCPGSFIQLERNANTLTTLPDRTFTFERQ